MGRAQRDSRDRRGHLPDSAGPGPALTRGQGPEAGPLSPGDHIRRSPNIWDSPAVYELENQAFDRAGLVEQAIGSVADWAGLDVLDIGCGTGYHLPRFAATARSVIGVEPHPPLAAIARRRVRRLPRAAVLEGRASALPIPDGSVDIAHARWAYFFGPGCEPGLAELDRVVRPGGAAFVIDNDAGASTFGRWFRRAFPAVDPARVEAFWADQGWSRIPVATSWQFETREDFAAVARIELPASLAEQMLAENPGRLHLDYAVNLWWRQY